MEEQLLDSWDIHNRMLFILFDAIEPDAFQGRPTGMTGRSVGNIFAHLHNIRLGWVEVGAPALMEGLEKIPTRTKTEKAALPKSLLRPALVRSAEAVRELVKTGKLKNLKPHLIGSFSYFIAHEWYHLGEIGMTLNEAGYKPDDQILYSLWSWGRWNPSQNAPKEGE